MIQVIPENVLCDSHASYISGEGTMGAPSAGF